MALRGSRAGADGMHFDVRGDVRDAIRDLDELERRVVPRVTTKSINNVLTQVKRHAGKRVAGRVGIPQKHINKRIRKKSAKVRRPSGYLLGLLQGIPLKDLGKPRQTGRGAKAGSIHRDGAFVVPSLGSHVFHRKGRSRLPIEKTKVEIREPLRTTIDRLMGAPANRFFNRVFDRNLKAAIEKQNVRANARQPR